MQLEAWVAGYLSGRAQGVQVDFLRNTDGDAVTAAIDLECSKAPLENVEAASVQVMQQLINQMSH